MEILYSRLPFLGWISPFPLLSISQNLEFCIYECPFGLDFPFPLLSIPQNLNSVFTIAIFGFDFPFPLLSISQNLEFCIYDCHFSVQTVETIAHLLTRLDPAEGAEAPADSDYLSVSVQISEFITFR